MNQIKVKRLSDLNEDKIEETIRFMMKQFKGIVALMNQSEATLVKFLMKAVVSEQCFVALKDEKIIGMIGVSTPMQSTFEISLKQIIKELGFMSGIRYSLATQGKISLEDNQNYIHTLDVDERYRCQGIGRLLLETCMMESDAEEYLLDVIEINKKAIRLYESCDFKVIHHKKKLGMKSYVVMKKSLIS